MFYDGGCPLCKREVAHYKRLDSAARVSWVDIDEDACLLEASGISVEQAMKRLHVKDHNGQLVTGAYAFHTLWRQLPYYRVLATLVSPAIVLAALDVIYSGFAKRRYAKRQRCTNASCGT